ncbi:MAG: PLP-dependent aminotransferase family protein [Oscillibacter sp.]|nr:PLP-dependent aminotransferase family protein [Oscillibacter sp.]
MRYIIDKANGPAYLQLYHQLRDDIINGAFGYNSKLPSKRVLSENAGVSAITVEHAYALLCDEGYAESRERSGYYVIFHADDGFAAPSSSPGTQPAPFHPSPSHPDFPFSLLSKTMRRVLAVYKETLLEKAPNAGCTELRTALKHYLARNRGIYADVEQIIIGSGAEYLYGLIIELLGRNRIIAIESPSYNKIEQVYQAAEIRYDALPLTGEGIDSTALSSTAANVLHTTPYRSFPSGVTATASKRHEYLRWASSGDRYIIEDDFESEFSVSTKPMETLFALSKQDNVIYLNTFSKTISPSIRVAYMVLPPKLAALFEKKLGFYSCTVPTFEQYTLTELLNNGDFERHINRVRRSKRKGHDT